MPFGLKNAPAAFQRAIDATCQGTAQRPFIDDVVVATPGDDEYKRIEEHIRESTNLLECLQRDNWKVNPDKCKFLQDSVQVLGWKVDAKGIQAVEDGINTILAENKPKDAKELQRFLGLVNFHRIFLKDVARHVAVLSDLLRKENAGKFNQLWSQAHDDAWDILRKALATKTTLARPDFSRPFQVYTDASDDGIGAILTQDGKIVEFFSEMLSKAQKKWSVSEKEAFALVKAATRWKDLVDSNGYFLLRPYGVEGFHYGREEAGGYREIVASG